MSREHIPVTPDLLRWARGHAGFSLEELRKDFPHIDAWERGDRFPTYPQLERLSEKFKVPVAVFFFPEPPVLPSIHRSFRTVPAAQFNALPQPLRFLLRKATVLQLNLYELNTGQNPSDKFILDDLHFTQDTDIYGMAQRVRDYLGVPIAEQLDWPDTDTAFASWRGVLERHGIAVFKDAFRDDNYAGFCLYDQVFPLIYVNNSVRTREIFTLFHELAHLLFQTSGIDALAHPPATPLSSVDQRMEVICNNFAAEFLLPSKHFAVEAAKLRQDANKMARLADLYNVSREAVLRRFLDHGEITTEEYRATARQWAAQRRNKGDGGNHYWTKITYLGTNYIGLAFSRYHQSRITERELADYLDTKVRHLPKLEGYCERKVVV